MMRNPLRWLRFRRQMKAISRRGPTLGVDLTCTDIGREHDWVEGSGTSYDPRPRRICGKCGISVPIEDDA